MRIGTFRIKGDAQKCNLCRVGQGDNPGDCVEREQYAPMKCVVTRFGIVLALRLAGAASLARIAPRPNRAPDESTF